MSDNKEITYAIQQTEKWDEAFRKSFYRPDMKPAEETNIASGSILSVFAGQPEEKAEASPVKRDGSSVEKDVISVPEKATIADVTTNSAQTKNTEPVYPAMNETADAQPGGSGLSVEPRVQRNETSFTADYTNLLENNASWALEKIEMDDVSFHPAQTGSIEISGPVLDEITGPAQKTSGLSAQTLFLNQAAPLAGVPINDLINTDFVIPGNMNSGNLWGQDAVGPLIPETGPMSFSGSILDPAIADNQSVLWKDTALSGMPDQRTEIHMGYSDDNQKKQAVTDLFRDIASFADNKRFGQPDGRRVEDILEMITGVIDENKPEKKVSDKTVAVDPFPYQETENSTMDNGSFRSSADTRSYIESAARYKENTVKSININLSGGLVSDIQNYSGTEPVEINNDFTDKVAESFHTILQRALNEVK